MGGLSCLFPPEQARIPLSGHLSNSTQESSQPLEGTPFLRRPCCLVPGGEGVQTSLAFMSFAPWMTQAVPGRPEARVLAQLTSCLESGLSLSFGFQIPPVPPYALQLSNNGNMPFAPSTHPPCAPYHSVAQLRCPPAQNPCLSFSPGEFHTA